MNIDDNLLIRSLAALDLDADQVAEAERRAASLRAALCQMKEAPHTTTVPNPLEEGAQTSARRLQSAAPSPGVEEWPKLRVWLANPSIHGTVAEQPSVRTTPRWWARLWAPGVGLAVPVTIAAVSFVGVLAALLAVGTTPVAVTTAVLAGQAAALIAVTWREARADRAERSARRMGFVAVTNPEEDHGVNYSTYLAGHSSHWSECSGPGAEYPDDDSDDSYFDDGYRSPGRAHEEPQSRGSK